MVVLGSSSRVPIPGQGTCVVFLGETLNSHCAYFQMGTGEVNPEGKLTDGEAFHPGGLQLLLVALPYVTENWIGYGCMDHFA